MDDKRGHFAIEIVGKHIKDFYLTHAKEAAEKQVEFTKYGTQKEIYLKEVFRLYIIINEAIDRTKHTETYLTIEKIPEHFSINEIEEVEYYRHHIEFFHIKCISILDYSINLLNHSLRLGIPTRKCSAYNIIENTILKGQPIVDKLKLFEKEISQLKRNRNIIIHQGDFESVALNEIDSKIFSNELFDFGVELTAYFEKEKQEKIKKTVEIINGLITNIENHVGELYECLIPIIKEKILMFELNE